MEARRDVVGGRVAGDVVHGVGNGNVLAGGADDDRLPRGEHNTKGGGCVRIAMVGRRWTASQEQVRRVQEGRIKGGGNGGDTLELGPRLKGGRKERRGDTTARQKNGSTRGEGLERCQEDG